MLPEVIANGCAVVLFPPDPEPDMGLVAAPIAGGRIAAARLDAALTPVIRPPSVSPYVPG